MCDLQPRLSELLKNMHSVKKVSAKVSAKTLKFGNRPTARPNSGDLFNKQKTIIEETNLKTQAGRICGSLVAANRIFRHLEIKHEVDPYLKFSRC